MPQDDKARFMKVYANLPVGLRSDIVAVIEDGKVGPITWNAAYVEISNETKLGNKILAQLIKLEII